MSETVNGARVEGAGAKQILDVARGLAERNRQLEEALATRVVIEQAKGVLMERYGIDADAAFALIRRGARNDRIRVRDLAAAVVGSRATPESIAEGL